MRAREIPNRRSTPRQTKGYVAQRGTGRKYESRWYFNVRDGDKTENEEYASGKRNQEN